MLLRHLRRRSRGASAGRCRLRRSSCSCAASRCASLLSGSYQLLVKPALARASSLKGGELAAEVLGDDCQEVLARRLDGGGVEVAVGVGGRQRGRGGLRRCGRRVAEPAQPRRAVADFLGVHHLLEQLCRLGVSSTLEFVDGARQHVEPLASCTMCSMAIRARTSRRSRWRSATARRALERAVARPYGGSSSRAASARKWRHSSAATSASRGAVRRQPCGRRRAEAAARRTARAPAGPPLAGGARARRARWPRRARTDEVVVELLRHVASRAPEARDGVEAQVDGRRLDVRERMKERQARCVRALLRRSLHLARLHEDEALLARRHVGGRLSSDALAAVHPPRVRLPVALARAPPLRERVRHPPCANCRACWREHARLDERRARRDRVARFHRVALAAASAGRAHAWAGAAPCLPRTVWMPLSFPLPRSRRAAQPPPPPPRSRSPRSVGARRDPLTLPKCKFKPLTLPARDRHRAEPRL